MQDALLTNKRFGILSIALALFSILLSLISGNMILAFLSSIFTTIALLFWKYGYILVPIFIQKLNIIELINSYEIPPSQDVVIKKVNNKFYASCFLSAKIMDSITEKSDSEKALFIEYFERAVSSARHVCKFSVLVSNVDLTHFEEEIKTKRNFAETMKARFINSGSTNLPEIARLEREIVMWNRQLQRLSTGERPVEVICYLMTTSCAISKDDSVSKAKAQANEIKASVGNALNVEISNLKGEDMKKCFEWEFTIPASHDELVDSVYKGLL